MPGVVVWAQVGDHVTLTYKEGDEAAGSGAGGAGAAPPRGPHVVLEWQGGSEADMVADAVVAIILQVGGLAGLLAFESREERRGPGTGRSTEI